jgi:hypothetical protein
MVTLKVTPFMGVTFSVTFGYLSNYHPGEKWLIATQNEAQI